jgi:xanthine dehydrogenase accessory factor
MLIDEVGTLGTVGGGRLEWHATAAARALLAARCAVRIDELVLGPELGQCCGGRVELWLERLTRDDLRWLRTAAAFSRSDRGCAVTLATTLAEGSVSHRMLRSLPPVGLRLQRGESSVTTLFETLSARRPKLWIHGAGHVGQALVRLLADVDVFDITWIDPRPSLLPAGLPEGVATICAAPVPLATSAGPGIRHVVLTHDHAVDFDICRTILERGDFAWLGLIGSASKAARFRSRLRRAGISRADLARLVCPIGIDGIATKHPAGIAIAIAAQLLRLTAAADVPASSAAECGDCGSCGAAAGGYTRGESR